MNDNVMMTNAVVCVADGKRAREIAMSAGRGYLNTMVNMYHSTMPKQPERGHLARPPPLIRTEEELDYADRRRATCCAAAPSEVQRADRQVPGGRL
jgi:hypothetical protein